MPKITSIKGARGYGRRRKFVPYLATSVQTGTQYASAFCSPGGGAGNAGYILNTTTGICSHPGYGDPFTPNDLQTVPVYEYTCPLGGTYNSVTGMCE